MRFSFDIATDMRTLDLRGLATGTVTARSATALTIKSGDLEFRIQGADLANFDASGRPRAGDVFFINIYQGDTLIRSVSPGGMAAAEFFKIVASGSASAVIAALTRGDDIINGSVGDDVLLGGAGDDTIDGFRGKNVLDGGDGDDQLNSDSATDTLIGGAGEDRASLDYVGLAGDITLGLGAPTAVSQIKIDGKVTGTITGVEALRFRGGAGDATITGGAGADSLNGGDGDDRLSGGAGDDVLEGGEGRNVLNGGDGDDEFQLLGYALGYNDIVGGGGEDFLNAAVDFATLSIDISDARRTTDILIDGTKAGTVTGVERLSARGSDGDDRLIGGSGADALDGGRGVNLLNGGGGDDVITSRSAADTIVGGTGHDTLSLYLNETGSVAFDISDPTKAAKITVGGVAKGTITGVEQITYSAGAGGDRIVTGAGDDTFYSGTGKDLFDGGAGIDTYVASFGDGNITIDLKAGTAVKSAADTDTLKNVENADGGRGDDILRGDDRANVLFGGYGGKDTLDGRGGDDVLRLANAAGATVIGGDGDDLAELGFNGARGGVTLTLGAPGAVTTFTVAGGASGTLTGVERLVFYGTLFGDKVTGGAGADRFANNFGDDVFDGGGGIDTLSYITDYASGPPKGRVVVDLQAGVSKRYGFEGGNADALLDQDTIRNIENVIGSELSDEIRGDAGDNRLDGGWGFASGGSAADVLIGRKGNDTYVVDSKLDTVVELAGEGDDLILSSVDWSLAGIYVERLTLTGEAIKATGNSFANTITGNDRANIIDGGRGDDVMIGGKGSDTYHVDSRADRVVERNYEGDDLVISSVDFNMGGSYLERLTLTGTAKYGTGNSLANTITGNASNNVLSGGAGADILIGGAGHDRYIVDNARDRVVEKTGEGSDLIVSSVSYSLAGTYVERLELSGTAALNATGNSLDNTLTGNGGANRLEGGGGVDTLIGGAGGDTYVYRAASDSTVARSDTIVELGFGDRLDLSLIDANTSVSGNQAFALVDAFSGARGQATLTYDAGTKFSTLLLDLDGDRAADMRILIGGDANEARIVW